MTTRREFIRNSAALAVFPPELASAVNAPPARKTELWFSKPASRWMEAVPIGNGRIGGMVFGGTSTERIALTESTVWSGAHGSKDVNPTALENLGPIRDLMYAGRYAEAGELCKQHLLGRGISFGTHLPMANLELAFDNTPVQNYRRSLDLDEAIAHISYTRGNLRFHRELFCSNPDGVLVVRVTSPNKGSINFGVSFGKLILPGVVSIEDGNTLVLRGHAFEHLHSDGEQGVQFETRVRVLAEAGSVRADGARLHMRDADAVTLFVVAGTNMHGADPSAQCQSTLAASSRQTYAQLRSRHIADHQALFRRVHIDLGADPVSEKTPTDERRRAVEAGKEDPELAALFFQYGRYLTIAGSRANSPLPLALQGIWNDGLASSMGWTDDFHLDINTQQNYWAAEVCNLSECHTPLFSLIDTMRTSGRATARQMYGASGWVTHVVTNPWGYSAPGWGLGWGIFVTGGVWISLQLWEHYRFTQDRQFLERAYPVLKEAADFFFSYMVKHPRHGWLVTGPSVSPENWFLDADGKPCSESMGPTADRVLVYALLSASIDASAILGVDEDFRAKAKATLDQLPPLQIGKYGQVQEWLEDFNEAQPNHRHMSHLTALYPEHQISPLTTPALAQAARVTIERRTSQPNWEDSEWGRANLVNFYARLLDGDAAHHHLVGLIANAAEDSLLTYSRGGVAGAESNIFAIDGNTAGAAGIAEMLLQSQAGELHLLPALPSAWPQGSIRGLCARVAIEVSLSWSGGKLAYANLKSNVEQACPVRHGTKVIRVTLPPQRSVILRPEDFA
jgi:alpha-L-fucosidase 2